MRQMEQLNPIGLQLDLSEAAAGALKPGFPAQMSANNDYPSN
jgi:hypothetical protein